MISAILAFLISLSVIIVIHELGHYLAARWMGVHVEVFSLGYGRRLFGKRIAGTDFRVSAFPLGGYAKMYGDITEDVAVDMMKGKKEEEDVKAEETFELPEGVTSDNSFFAKSRWQRFIILVAGSVFNIIFAILLIWITNMLGREMPAYKYEPPVLGGAWENSPAGKAGFMVNDRILEINGKPMRTWEDVELTISINPEQEIDIKYERDGAVSETVVKSIAVTKNKIGYIGLMRKIPLIVGTVEPDSPADKAGLKSGDIFREINGVPIHSRITGLRMIAENGGRELNLVVERNGSPVSLVATPETVTNQETGEVRGMLGFNQIVPSIIRKYGVFEGLTASAAENARFTGLFFVVIGKLVTGNLPLRSMSGLPEITKLSIDVAREQGTVPFIFLMGFISLNLALFNLLPIPLLDGGSIFILALEGIRRKDFSLVTKERILQVGFIIIVALVIIVLYNDAVKLFFSK